MENPKFSCIFASAFGGIAQLARAPALQAGGRRFDSDYLHQAKKAFPSVGKAFFCICGNVVLRSDPEGRTLLSLSALPTISSEVEQWEPGDLQRFHTKSARSPLKGLSRLATEGKTFRYNKTPRHRWMTGCRIRKWQLPTLPPGGAVPSAMVSLTSLFGMGRGGSSPL